MAAMSYTTRSLSSLHLPEVVEEPVGQVEEQECERKDWLREVVQPLSHRHLRRTQPPRLVPRTCHRTGYRTVLSAPSAVVLQQ